MLIGLVGYKGSGKGEAASSLMRLSREASTPYFTNVKMAGALKLMLGAYFMYIGMDEDAERECIEGAKKESPIVELAGRTPRYAMQTLGTEWGRALIGKDFWINAFKMRCQQFPNVVCDDVRFENEAQAIRDLGGVLVRITRPDNVIDASHPSEQEIGLIKCDHTIVNDSTIKVLQLRMRLLVAELEAAQ